MHRGPPRVTQTGGERSPRVFEEVYGYRCPAPLARRRAVPREGGHSGLPIPTLGSAHSCGTAPVLHRTSPDSSRYDVARTSIRRTQFSVFSTRTAVRRVAPRPKSRPSSFQGGTSTLSVYSPGTRSRPRTRFWSTLLASSDLTLRMA